MVPYDVASSDTRSALIMFAHISLPLGFETKTIAPGLAYSPSAATVLAVGYALYYLSMDVFVGVRFSIQSLSTFLYPVPSMAPSHPSNRLTAGNIPPHNGSNVPLRNLSRYPPLRASMDTCIRPNRKCDALCDSSEHQCVGMAVLRPLQI